MRGGGGQSGDDLEREYRRLAPSYKSLAEEVEFALREGMTREGIRSHTLAKRVKTLDSFREKVARKTYTSAFEQTDDLAGVRVVVLFRSALPKVKELIERLFVVIEEVDKVEADDATFGYMSIHYVVRIRDHHAGPRYDSIRGLRCEIQVRTIVMDAWANVSHYLAYKGESTIPRELRKDFNALSGLFYVADQHFELFFSESIRSQERAQEEVRAGVDELDLNTDTLAALLAEKYPDRRQTSREVVSELMTELTALGYTTVGELDRVLTGAAEAFREYEEEKPPSQVGPGGPPGKYAPAGVVRVALAIADPEASAYRHPDEADYVADLAARYGVERSSPRD